MTGSMAGSDGRPFNYKQEIPSRVLHGRHWNEKGEITEEKLFYDLVGLMRQLASCEGAYK